MAEQAKQNNNSGGAQPLPLTLPEPTVWPAAMALGVTWLAFGVVTSWIMSLVGFILFIISAAGWVEDLRNEHKQ